MDTADGERNINNWKWVDWPADFHLLRYLVSDIIIQEESPKSALTEDNGPGSRRKSAPVMRNWGRVLGVRVRRARTAAVQDIRTPCRARLG